LLADWLAGVETWVKSARRYNAASSTDLSGNVMAIPSSTWLHENFEHTGSAFGLRMARKLDEVQSPFQKIEMYESTD